MFKSGNFIVWKDREGMVRFGRDLGDGATQQYAILSLQEFEKMCSVVRDATQE